jgi:hypothetical protein
MGAMSFHANSRALTLFAVAAHATCFGQTAPATPPDALFTVLAQDQQAVVRVLTQALVCPGIEWDDQAARRMSVRAPGATVPRRSGSAQKESKPAVFQVLTCEAAWPAGIKRARVAGRELPAPQPDIRRIVIIADTGCRLKASEKAFQPCNDRQAWPLARIAQSAAAKKPDLVLHIGDIHYRESPCPSGDAGCANSPWGYGYDAWQADFFAPAKPLLAAAPWVFVRGNHESCFRAGQGWFRFIDTQPWSQTRSCNDPANDGDADYSQPYAVALNEDTQLIVFDSSKTNGKPFSTQELSFTKYTQELRAVAQLTQQKTTSFFMSHHPLLAVASVKDPHKFKPGGNEGLQSVFSALYPERLFPQGVSLALQGHVHLFEAISFKGAQPASLVLGNSGSANEGRAPDTLPAGAQLYPGAEVEDYAARSEFGFATLDRVAGGASGDWLLTEYDVDGLPVIECALSGGKSRCSKVGAASDY